MRKGSAADPVASREEKIWTEKFLSVGRISSACSWELPGNKQPENECETESRGDGRRPLGWAWAILHSELSLPAKQE